MHSLYMYNYLRTLGFTFCYNWHNPSLNVCLKAPIPVLPNYI